jgi:DivIVA domain-containing protein
VVPLILLALVAVALVVSVLGVASGRIPADPLADAVHTTPDTGLPDEPTASDVDAVRFDTAMRGYRVDEVDAHLEVLRDELAERERVVSELRASPPPGPTPAAASPATRVTPSTPAARSAPAAPAAPAASPRRGDGG